MQREVLWRCEITDRLETWRADASPRILPNLPPMKPVSSYTQQHQGLSPSDHS